MADNALDPFAFNLKLAVENNGELSVCNPFKNDPEFLKQLAIELERRDKVLESFKIKRLLENKN